MSGETTVEVDGRRLKLSNLDKVLYPAAGFGKRDVIEYYQQVAPVMLPHVRGRPATLVRFPDGVESKPFFEKDHGRHAPEWVRTATLVSGARGQGHATNHHAVFDDLPTLVWAANLAGLEIHVPQWTVQGADRRVLPDLLVLDLDPGPPATIVECARLAERLRTLLSDDGMRPFVKTSGSKGMQLYCAVRPERWESTSEYAKKLAGRLAAETPESATDKMTKSLRSGKVFVDWSQNNPAKTTIAAYSLRGREQPSVSTPVTWEELESCHEPDDLFFTARDVLERVSRSGDLFADLHRHAAPLP